MNANPGLVSKPFENISTFVQSDRLALAHQLSLCRTDQSGWHPWMARARAAQAFAAGHLVSAVLLLSLGAQAMAWLMG